MYQVIIANIHIAMILCALVSLSLFLSWGKIVDGFFSVGMVIAGILDNVVETIKNIL